MLYIQSLERQSIKTLITQQSQFGARQDSNLLISIKTHRNYSTISSKFQSRKKKGHILVAANKTLENKLPEKNIFTSKGIIDSCNLEVVNRKAMLKDNIKYKKREKNLSLCNNLVSNIIRLPRAKTPKIQVKSVFNFNKFQRKYTQDTVQDECRRSYRKSKKKPLSYSYQKYHSERKRIKTQIPFQKNQFIGWQTQANNYYEYIS